MAATSRTQSKPKPKRTPRPSPKSIDGYLAALRPDQRAALQRLREIIRAAAPGVEEGISYQLPAFRWDGRWVVWIGAAAEHCAMYGALDDDLHLLKGYDTSGRGTLRFRPDRPLPATLVRKLVKARIARNAARTRTRTR